MSLELHNLAAKQVGVKCFFRNPNSFYHMDLGACLVLLGPKGSIQGPVLNGLGYVLGFDCGHSLQIRDRPRHFQNAVVGAGAETLLAHCPLQ